MAAIGASTQIGPSETRLPPSFDAGSGPQGADGTFGSQQTIGGTEGNFADPDATEDDDEKNKTDQTTGLKKKADKPAAKKLPTCS